MRSARNRVCGLVVVMICIASLGGNVHAVTVHYSEDGATTVVTDLTGFMTDGDDMAGMAVTAFFSGGGSETVVWVGNGAGGGSALGTGWILFQSGDTFTSNWTFDVFRDQTGGAPLVERILLVGFTGDEPVDNGTVFDRTQPSFGTDGSAQGRDFEIINSSGSWTDLLAIYRDPVDSQADDPPAGAVGDLFRQLLLAFGTFDGDEFFPIAFGPDDTLVFRQDTDNVGIRANGGDPGGEGFIPAPAALPAGLTLLGMAALRRRRRTA